MSVEDHRSDLFQNDHQKVHGRRGFGYKIVQIFQCFQLLGSTDCSDFSMFSTVRVYRLFRFELCACKILDHALFGGHFWVQLYGF